MRQVIINLVDNALEALGGPGAPPRPDGSVPLIALFTVAEASTSGRALTIGLLSVAAFGPTLDATKA